MNPKLNQKQPAQLPHDLAAVALIDAKIAASTGGMSVSWWFAEVKAGRAPEPVIRSIRCSRWSMASVARFWADRAADGVDAQAAKRVAEQAKSASDEAKSRRSERRLQHRSSTSDTLVAGG